MKYIIKTPCPVCNCGNFAYFCGSDDEAIMFDNYTEALEVMEQSRNTVEDGVLIEGVDNNWKIPKP